MTVKFQAGEVIPALASERTEGGAASAEIGARVGRGGGGRGGGEGGARGGGGRGRGRGQGGAAEARADGGEGGEWVGGLGAAKQSHSTCITDRCNFLATYSLYQPCT